MILLDAGPLVAIIDVTDQHHAACTATLKTIRQPMATVWPVLSEAMYLLADVPRLQEGIWEMIVMQKMHDFLVARVAGEFVDVVATINELADVSPHITQAGAGSDDAF